MAEYRAFIESRSLWESMELDKSLLACAVQSAAIEELESNQELNHSTNQALLGRIKNQVKTRYQADIVTGYAVMLQPVRTALDPEIDKKTQEANRYRDNLLMAMFGSLALIVPMLIMSLHPTQVTTLLTTSIFVSVVATILAAVMDNAEPKDVVGAVAAYTAVLVVFVGTTNSGTSTGSSTSPSSSATSGKHLSSGAIVGIVLGLLVGLLLLGTLCYFCVLKAGFEVFLVLFGLGKRRRRERMRRERTEIIDERLL
jgi:hypothetical protein